ncbi:MAG TPA: A/G-specific adenine glycosylase [Flavobacterium sp.]|nr:A/G-specific adenine glycosylase [Flavobacterium sp.]
MNFTENLLYWYGKNKRNLPWRTTKNPYYIWLSEVILQQTRVEQGLPYYQAFIQNFPTLKDLAFASEDDVLKLWQGLGYYSRARNLHHTAKTIYFELNDQFPTHYNEIIKLKGIGPYTAAAIASFAFKEPVGVVDGNVFRVLARYFGIYDDIATAKTRTIFQKIVNELISTEHPDLFNHAIMDLGATICLPNNNPKCLECPLQNGCFAFLHNAASQLPIKIKKITVKDRFFNFIILKNNHQIAIEQRTEKDIWQKLYQFPLLETANANEETIYEQLTTLYPDHVVKKITPNDIKHKLSHQQLHINFYEIEVDEILPNHHFVAITDLELYAYPIVIWNFMKDYFKLEKN